MSDDTAPGPGIGTMRAASASLMAANLDDRFREQLARAGQLARYHLIADALGLPRDRAAEILRNAQNELAGSTPTVQHLERARRDLIEEGRADTMPEELWAVVQRLAAETQFSTTDLTTAVDVLQSRQRYLEGPPWPIEQIVRVLSQLADGAARSGVSLVSLATSARAVCVRQPTRRELNRAARMIGCCFDVPPWIVGISPPPLAIDGHAYHRRQRNRIKRRRR